MSETASITPDRLYALPADGSGPWVYLHHAADGTVLYVGSSIRSVRSRQNSHKRAEWWPQVATLDVVGPFDTVHDARVTEKDLIRKHDPAGNRMHTSRWTPNGARRHDLLAMAQERVVRLRTELAAAERRLAELEQAAS